MTHLIKQKAIGIALEKKTGYILIGFIFMCLAFYVYFANSAVRAVTTLENVKEDFGSLTLKVSDLESKRLSMENRINISRAKTLGFVEVKNQIFIMSKKNANLSLKTN